MTMMIGEHRILVGDVVEQLGTLPDESVHCVVTSPPYWGLRDYGVEGMLGLEPTPEAHVTAMVGVFREVRRVLRSDGVCWLNYGDCYAGAQGAGGGWTQPGYEGGDGTKFKNERSTGDVKLGVPRGLKPKDLVCMPWRVAMALQADGWWLRSALPWVKRSAMPESCTDRPASALEYVFLLTKSARYFFDMEAVRQKHDPRSENSERPPTTGASSRNAAMMGRERLKPVGRTCGVRESGRAYRNTDLFYASTAPPHGMIFAGDEPVGLDVNPQPFSEAHFATFPERLVEPLIKAGTSEKGCCPECGKAWERVVQESRYEPPESDDRFVDESRCDKHRKIDGKSAEFREAMAARTTLGWRPGCECSHEALGWTEGMPKLSIPCLILDPFAGSGTTLLVANRLGRDAIGIELNAEYAAMAEKRIGSGLRPSTYRDLNGTASAPLFEGVT